MMQLSPCPSCARHVRVNEARCPFCSASLYISGTRSQVGYLRDHAVAVVGVTLALAGCNARPEAPPKKSESPSSLELSLPQTPKTPESISTTIPHRSDGVYNDAPAYGAPLPPPASAPKPVYGAPKTMYGLPRR